MKKAHLKILQEINKSIPKEWVENLIIKVDGYKDTKIFLQKAIDDPGLDPEKKETCKNMLLSGYLDNNWTEIEDPEINKKISQYILDEVNKKVESGELPKSILKEKVIKKTKKQ